MAVLPPMQRARGPGLRASTYQYQAAHLVYRRDETWHFIAELSLFSEVRRRLSPGLTAAWHRLALNLPGIAEEREAEPAAIWLAEHGHAIGARTPNLAERARAAGIHDYCLGLLLCGGQRGRRRAHAGYAPRFVARDVPPENVCLLFCLLRETGNASL